MTALRSYDHYAPDITATVLPGVPASFGPVWQNLLTVRAVTPGTRVRWSDGSSTDTRLVRLDGRHDAYEVALSSNADAIPTRPNDSSYHETSWLDSDRLADVWALTQVLIQGYGPLGLEELRRRLRRAGYAVAADELTVAHAIAATQAAVWHVTTGRELDARHVNPLAVSHLYHYLLGRAGVGEHGRRERRAALGTRYFVAGGSAVEIRGAEVVDTDGRSLGGVVVPGQRFHLIGARRRITLRHGAVRARLLSGPDRLLTVTAEAAVVVDHILAG